MHRITIPIDHQSTRNQYRLRVMKGKNEAVAIYFKDIKDASRVKSMLRKTINGLLKLEVQK